MSDTLISALELSIPCFFAFPFAFFALANWELDRESRKTEDGLPIAADAFMVIAIMILSFFVSLSLMATTILLGFAGFALSISTAAHVILGLLTGCFSALLLLLRDIIDLTLFIGKPKGTHTIRLIGAFVPPIVVPILASIISVKYPI